MCVNAVLVLVIKNLELTNQKILVRRVARRTEYSKAVIQPLTTGTASPWYHKWPRLLLCVFSIFRANCPLLVVVPWELPSVGGYFPLLGRCKSWGEPEKVVMKNLPTLCNIIHNWL